MQQLAYQSSLLGCAGVLDSHKGSSSCCGCLCSWSSCQPRRVIVRYCDSESVTAPTPPIESMSTGRLPGWDKAAEARAFLCPWPTGRPSRRLSSRRRLGGRPCRASSLGSSFLKMSVPGHPTDRSPAYLGFEAGRRSESIATHRNILRAAPDVIGHRKGKS